MAALPDLCTLEFRVFRTALIRARESILQKHKKKIINHRQRHAPYKGRERKYKNARRGKASTRRQTILKREDRERKMKKWDFASVASEVHIRCVNMLIPRG